MINFKEIWKNFIGSQYQYWYKEDLEEITIEIAALKQKIDVLKKLIQGDEIEEPEKLGDTNIYKLRTLLSPYCEDIHFSDRTYSTTSKDEAREFSISTKVEARKWLSEQHDCDEFSFALMGYWNDGLKQFAFGIAWNKRHAFNIMVDNKDQIWIIEPQSNKFMKIEDTQDNYMYSNIQVIMI